MADLSSGNFVISGTSGADVTKPVFKSMHVSLNEATVGDTVKISVDAEDNESGIDFVYLYYQMPITERVKGYELNYNAETNRYEGTIDITNEMENGTWKVKWLHIKDNAGNEQVVNNQEIYSSGNLADLSSGNFAIFEEENPILPLNHRVVTKNEIWISEVIEGDVYIGPEAVITISGDVIIKGDICIRCSCELWHFKCRRYHVCN